MSWGVVSTGELLAIRKDPNKEKVVGDELCVSVCTFSRCILYKHLFKSNGCSLCLNVLFGVVLFPLSTFYFTSTVTNSNKKSIFNSKV